MTRRLTIVLSDDEYAALEARAAQERRTVRQMAEWLVTRPSLIISQPNPYVQLWQYAPWNPLAPTVWCKSTAENAAQYMATGDNILTLRPDASLSTATS